MNIHDIELPPLVGTLAGLPDRHREVIEAYGQACARAAVEQAVLQSEQVQAWKRDAERYRYIKKGNQWIVAATQTGFQLDGEELDDLIDNKME